MTGYTVDDLLEGVDEIPEADRYTGPKAFNSVDGWHYTVVDDSASLQRAITIAQADLDHAKAQGFPDRHVADLDHNLRIIQLSSHEKMDKRLYHDGRGNFRLAVEGDKSHQDQFHRNFATIEIEGGGPSLRLTAEDMASVRKFLDDRARGES